MQQTAPMPIDSNDRLIGREAELAVLRDAVEHALVGRDSWLMLAGEPGIGKTRLAEAAAVLAEQCGMRALWGRCPEEAGAPPFLPWTRALEAALRAQGAGARRPSRPRRGGGDRDRAQPGPVPRPAVAATGRYRR